MFVFELGRRYVIRMHVHALRAPFWCRIRLCGHLFVSGCVAALFLCSLIERWQIVWTLIKKSGLIKCCTYDLFLVPFYLGVCNFSYRPAIWATYVANFACEFVFYFLNNLSKFSEEGSGYTRNCGMKFINDTW